MQASTGNEDVCFLEARQMFEEMVDWLSSESVCGLEHGELEKKLFVNGNELLRKLLQGYLDRRSDDDIVGDCLGSDGAKRTHKRKLSRKLTTIEPFVRTAQQIVNPKEQENLKRPRPQGKRVWASLVKEPETIISEAFDEALHRDPNQQKNWVALVDGNKTQLRLLKQLARKHNIKLTIVLDIIHVIEYLWKAAFVFSSPSSKQTEDWVSLRLLHILEGKSSLVAAGIRRSATLRQFTPEQRLNVDKSANYLLNNSDYLKYHDYLAFGFPIATGVIEGACRYLIKDRMDITGARWSLQGAEAVLRLRSLHVSGDWNDYWRFHLQQEHQRHHLALYQGGIPLLKGVTQARCSTTPLRRAMLV